jgi:hypothetical protein
MGINMSTFNTDMGINGIDVLISREKRILSTCLNANIIQKIERNLKDY